MFKKYFCYLGLICIAVILIQSSILLSDCKAKSSVTVDWAKLSKAWEEYLDYPSSENADKVSELLPDSGHAKYNNDKEAENAIDSIFSTLSMLERQVYYSDRGAVNLAFHLYSISDGEFGEYLDIILGALIRINARLFLQELLHNRPLVPELDGLVGNFGPGYYVYTDEAERLETSLRIKALKSVQDSSLINIRNECIKQLEVDRESPKK